MAADPKLRAFITAVTFADGSVHLNAMAVPNEVCAMTTSGIEAGRRFQGPTAGFAYAEISAEFLRAMLRSIETGKPSGEVVSLVSDNPRATNVLLAEMPKQPDRFQWGEGHPVTQWPWLSRCEVHPHAPLLNGHCPVCQHTGGAA